MSAEHDLAKAIADAVDAKVAGTRPQSSTMPATYQGTDSEGKAWVLLPGATEPTPVSRMAVEAAQGDTVSVTVANGKATIDSNVSNPSAGLAGVKVVEKTANVAKDTAVQAIDYASAAQSAASAAQTSADAAYRHADEAAQEAANAQASAATANIAAVAATEDAGVAHAMAESAAVDASQASASATVAKQSADKATFALSDVENVVGTLNWIAEHGEYVLTEDTAIVDGKAYYRRVGGYFETADTTAVYGKEYFTRSGSGTDEDPYVYTPLVLPDSDEYTTDTLRITQQPRSCFVSAIGDNATFGITTNDTGATYQWRYQSAGSSSWNNTGLTGNQTATLGPFATTTTNAQVGRKYSCKVVLSNSTTVYSGNATIIVGTVYESDSEVYELVASPVASELSTYYELQLDESVQNYLASHLWLDDYGLNLSVDSANGYRIHQGTVDGTHSAGAYIIDPQGAIVASFGAGGFQVGLDDESYLIGDYHSLQLIDKEGDTYFHVSDLRGADGTVEITAHFDCDGSRTYVLDPSAADTEYTVTVSDGSGGTVTKTTRSFQFSESPTDGAVITVVYRTADPDAKAYTLGYRMPNRDVGPLSYAEGGNVTASGLCSHAEGALTTASGFAAHAEGRYTVANGEFSHAEGQDTTAGYRSHAEGWGTTADSFSHAEGTDTTAGYRSHAEGRGTTALSTSHAEGQDTKASSWSHAEGKDTEATGSYSHAQNLGTKASSNSQTALGKYNATGSTYAVIVGNGTSDSARSNALTTDWDGIVGAQNVGMYGTCDTAAATADKVATLDDYGVTFKLVKGAVVRIYMANSNTVADPTLNVNSTGAVAIKRYGTTAPGTGTGSSWIGGTVMTFLYDGTYWRLCDHRNNDNTIPSAYCSTAADTAAKVASCSGYALLSKSFLHVILTTSNTAASALTLNVNSKGAKPIYINGSASSSSNYTLPAGSYLVYYNGTNYYFRTDGYITANVTGTASKLQTARSLYVALGTTYDSSAPVTFDGSAAKALPVSGTLPVARGGTGQTATGATTTLSDIGTAGSNVTVTCSYSYWGKVASFYCTVKANAAISASATLFTFASGKRPKYQQYPQGSTSAIWTLTTGGVLKCASALTSGTTYYCSCTYLIA